MESFTGKIKVSSLFPPAKEKFIFLDLFEFQKIGKVVIGKCSTNLFYLYAKIKIRLFKRNILCSVFVALYFAIHQI